MKTSLPLVLAMLFAAAAHADHHEGKQLFNGKDLSGWDGDKTFWRVEDGAIVGESTPEKRVTQNTFLVWKDGTLKDFELSVKWRLRNGNSGIQYRSKLMDPEKFVVGGYQADIADNAYLGILYEERGRGIVAQVGQKVTLKTNPDQSGRNKHVAEVTGQTDATPEKVKATLKPEQWNEYVITVKGNQITQKLNGLTTVELIDDDAPRRSAEGILALQMHTGPPMKVEFKDIVLKPLP